MKKYQIFIGNIKECTKYKTNGFTISIGENKDKLYGRGGCYDIETESKMYKENAVLLKVSNNGYVDIELLNSVLDYINVRSHVIDADNIKLGGLVMPNHECERQGLFVDENSLKPYFSKNLNENINILELKRTIKN